MRKLSLLSASLLALTACTSTPEKFDTPFDAAPTFSQGAFPSDSLPALSDISEIEETVLPPVADPDLAPAVDLRDFEVCDIGFLWQELTGRVVACSGSATISFSAPMMSRSAMADRMEDAIRSIADVRKTAGGLEVVAKEEGGGGSGRAYAGTRDELNHVSLSAPVDAVRGAIRALSLDVTIVETRDDGVSVLANSEDATYLQNLFGSSDRVDTSFYVPSLTAESWNALAPLYLEGFAFDPLNSVLHVRASQAEVNSLFARLRYYTKPEAPVRVSAWIVESREDISRRFGSNLTSNGFSLLQGVITNASVLTPTLELLESSGEGRLLSSPELLVKSGQQARVNAGDSLPVPRTTVSEGIVSTEYEYRDTGITMSISPTVRPDGSVTLDVSLEASTASGAGEAPVIARRAVSSSLHVSDGQTIALSGLRTVSTSSTKSGMPGSLPLPLGRMDTSSGQSSYLTVFLSVDVLE